MWANSVIKDATVLGLFALIWIQDVSTMYIITYDLFQIIYIIDYSVDWRIKKNN